MAACLPACQPYYKHMHPFLSCLHGCCCIRDYRPMPELDTYEQEGLDEEPMEVDEEAEYEARRAAEEEMERRDGGGRGRGTLPRSLHGEHNC